MPSRPVRDADETLSRFRQETFGDEPWKGPGKACADHRSDVSPVAELTAVPKLLGFRQDGDERAELDVRQACDDRILVCVG